MGACTHAALARAASRFAVCSDARMERLPQRPPAARALPRRPAAAEAAGQDHVLAPTPTFRIAATRQVTFFRTTFYGICVYFEKLRVFLMDWEFLKALSKDFFTM